MAERNEIKFSDFNLHSLQSLIAVFKSYPKGVFTIYVDKMRGVGGLPDVNEMSTEGVGGPSNEW